MLAEDPLFVMAHSQLGWLYMRKLGDMVKARQHLEIAVKYGKGHQEPFTNYTFYLLEAFQYSEVVRFSRKAMYVPGIDRAYILALRGLAYESMKLHRNALRTFEKAKQYTLNEDYLGKLNSDKQRIYKKLNVFQRLSVLFV